MSTELSQQSQGQEQKYTVEALLASEKFSRKLAEIMGTEENVKRFVQVGLQCLKRQPKLAACSQATVFDCLIKLSQLGLEPDGYHAHLIPFNNKVKTPDGKERWESQCQLIVDYKGLINVIRRNPKVAVLKGGIIHEKDQFTFEEGSNRVFAHRRVYPKPGQDIKDNPIVLVYAFIRWTNQDWDVDVMTVDEVERIRARSRAKDFGPWVTDWAEMAMKTTIRHLSKRLELTYEERAIITADDDQFAYGNPFESAQAPQVTYTKPRFLSEPETSSSDQQRTAGDSGHATLQQETSAKQSSQRRDQRGKAEVQEANSARQTESKPESVVEERAGAGNGMVGAGQQDQQPTSEKPKEEAEKDYKYGPSDDSTSTTTADSERISSDRQKSEPVNEASYGKEIQTDMAGDVNAAERQKAGANLAKLIKLIQRDKIAEEKVIAVLINNERDTGYAQESGNVSDLPDESIDLCLRNWGSIVFNAKKLGD